MPNRELVAWILFGAIATALGVQTAFRVKDDRENGKMFYECAVALDECSQRCSDIADVYYKYADRIVDCTERICRVNGWVPPPDWNEE